MNEQQPSGRLRHGLRIDFQFQKLQRSDKRQYPRIEIIYLLAVVELGIKVPFQSDGIKVLYPFYTAFVKRIGHLAVIDQADQRVIRTGQVAELMEFCDGTEAVCSSHIVNLLLFFVKDLVRVMRDTAGKFAGRSEAGIIDGDDGTSRYGVTASWLSMDGT